MPRPVPSRRHTVYGRGARAILRGYLCRVAAPRTSRDFLSSKHVATAHAYRFREPRERVSVRKYYELTPGNRDVVQGRDGSSRQLLTVTGIAITVPIARVNEKYSQDDYDGTMCRACRGYSAVRTENSVRLPFVGSNRLTGYGPPEAVPPREQTLAVTHSLSVTSRFRKVNGLRLCAVVWRAALHLSLCIPGLITGVSASARSAIIVTVDVESAPDLPLPDQLDAVCADGSRCGLMEIVRLLNVSHSPGTFFLNVYEYKKYGIAPLRNIAMRLRDEQQDVALHTHPHWAYDANRPYMYDYSLEQQTRIVQDGVRLLREWTGLPVVAHRAGAYSADRNTLEALARNGIRIDSSLFFGEPASHLNGLGLPNNLPSVIEGITEIPVSVYQREELPAGLGTWVPPLKSISKIDVNSLINEQEARSALTAAVHADVPYILVFLHSFSLIDQPGANGAAPRANHKARQVFETLLRESTAAGLSATTMSALVAVPDVVTSGRRDSLPKVSVTVPAWKYLWHARHARYGMLFLTVAAAVFAALFAFGVARMHGGSRRLVE